MKYYKRGLWYVSEPGKDYVTFETEAEADLYINPVIEEDLEEDLDGDFEEWTNADWTSEEI